MVSLYWTNHGKTEADRRPGKEPSSPRLTLKWALAHPRKSERKHRLPKGWRWLKIGEWVSVGDLVCDSRLPPVEVIYPGGWKMDAQCHPVRRRLDR